MLSTWNFLKISGDRFKDLKHVNHNCILFKKMKMIQVYAWEVVADMK